MGSIRPRRPLPRHLPTPLTHQVGRPAGTVASLESEIGQAWSMRHRSPRGPALRSNFAGLRVPSSGDHARGSLVSALGIVLQGRGRTVGRVGITVDHVSVYRWVQRFNPLLIDAHESAGTPLATGGSSTKHRIKVWTMVLPVPGYRSVRPSHRHPGHQKGELEATRQFFTRALKHGPSPTDVTTDRAPAHPEWSMNRCPRLAMSWASTPTIQLKRIMVD